MIILISVYPLEGWYHMYVYLQYTYLCFFTYYIFNSIFMLFITKDRQ